MSVILNLNQSQEVAGLQTCTWTAPAATPITVTCQSTIPLASGLSIVINQNGSPVVSVGGSASNPSATQQSIGAGANISAAASDVITIVLTSSNAVDSIPNTVKSMVNLFQTI